jgi:hypothetical protein
MILEFDEAGGWRLFKGRFCTLAPISQVLASSASCEEPDRGLPLGMGSSFTTGLGSTSADFPSDFSLAML